MSNFYLYKFSNKNTKVIVEKVFFSNSNSYFAKVISQGYYTIGDTYAWHEDFVIKKLQETDLKSLRTNHPVIFL